MNVIGVAQNIGQYRPLVIVCSLLMSMHVSKENAFYFLLCMFCCVLIFFCFLFRIMQSTKQVNRTIVAQTFALRISDAYLDIYSTTSICFPILSTGRRNLFSHFYILAKQNTLSCFNNVHNMLLLNLDKCLYRYVMSSCITKMNSVLNSNVISTQLHSLTSLLQQY